MTLATMCAFSTIDENDLGCGEPHAFPLRCAHSEENAGAFSLREDVRRLVVDPDAGALEFAPHGFVMGFGKLKSDLQDRFLPFVFCRYCK